MSERLRSPLACAAQLGCDDHPVCSGTRNALLIAAARVSNRWRTLGLLVQGLRPSTAVHNRCNT